MKREDPVSLKEIIEKEEARSFGEIQHHSELLLDRHPELNGDTKEKLRLGIREMLSNHQKLKDQESKIIQSLLNRSLSSSSSSKDLQEVKILKKSLIEVYQLKSKNVLDLVYEINKMSAANELNQGVRDDLFILIRELR
jgi:hypothetical protein